MESPKRHPDISGEGSSEQRFNRRFLAISFCIARAHSRVLCYPGTADEAVLIDPAHDAKIPNHMPIPVTNQNMAAAARMSLSVSMS